MTQDRLREELRMLAQGAPGRAGSADLNEVHRQIARRRWRSRGIAVVAAMALIMAGAAATLSLGSDGRSDGFTGGREKQVPFSAFVEFPGDDHASAAEGTKASAAVEQPRARATIRFSIEVAFAEGRTLYEPKLYVGADSASGEMWPVDGLDHEGEDLDPLNLVAGQRVLIEARVQAACDETASVPEIAFKIPGVLPDGTRSSARFTPKNPEFYANAITLGCGLNVAAQVGGGTSGGGEVRIAFTVNNPSERPVTVTIPALAQGEARFDELEFIVPPHEHRTRTIAGHGVYCGAAAPDPWDDGRVLINGNQYDLPIVDSWEC